MPLFEINNHKLTIIEPKNFLNEKQLQTLVEHNLETVFKCRFIASEFITDGMSGRIDTLALSEENEPVIIEYKNVPSSELINQSLYYKSWLTTHKGDFMIAAQKVLGHSVVVDWTNIRVMCISPNYKKYDLHAVLMMNSNIELWSFRNYGHKLFLLEKVDLSGSGLEKEKVVGKKASTTKASGVYTFHEHIDGKSEKIRDLALTLQEYILNLDSAIQEEPRKNYIAYKLSQNIVCMEIQTQQIHIFLKLNPKEIVNPPHNLKDVSSIGHYGTGDTQITINSMEELEQAKSFVDLAYQKLGG